MIPSLTRFPRASLELLARRALLRRVDTKYALDTEQLGRVLERLYEHYAVLYAGEQRAASYQTVYFDSPSWRFLHDHQRGRRPRHKVRLRHYMDRQLSYLEVKKKTPAERTEKQRRQVPFGTTGFTDEDLAFIDEHCPVPAHELREGLWTNFERITLLGLHTEERLTLDTKLTFEGAGSTASVDGVVIAEVKQWKFHPRTPVVMALRGVGARPLSISKYCAAASMLLSEVRMQRYMPRLRAMRMLQDA